jgi:hypothetical protein
METAKRFSRSTIGERSRSGVDPLLFQVCEDLSDRLGLGDEGENFHLRSTPRADELHFKDEPQEFSPGPSPVKRGPPFPLPFRLFWRTVTGPSFSTCTIGIKPVVMNGMLI